MTRRHPPCNVLPMPTPTLPTAPANGVDRCSCGCKYWTPHYTDSCGHSIDYYTCFDCGDRFDPRDVHTEHCCADHGCCYNDSDCTVVTGQKPASFTCEVCDYIAQKVIDFIPALSDAQLISELRRRGFDTSSLTL